jgi:CubicO group peptidase (beta-lactamase class C family)
MRFLPWLAAALVLVGCGSDDPEPTPAPENEFAEFDALVESYLAENGITGATAAIVSEGEGVLHVRGYGAFGTDRISLIASSSKVLSAGVLLRLADDGLLDLDEPISTYLGDWGSFKTDITVAQLLSGSAGMPGVLDDPMYSPYICQYIDAGTLSACAEKIYTADDEAERVPPDTEFHYGGAQWQLAGGIAEVVSGKPWAELIREMYTEPCGLSSTAFANHFLKATLEAGGASFSYPGFFHGDLADLDATDNPNIEGGAYTTIGDYAQILLLHLRGGLCGETRVLSDAAVERMQADRIGDVYGGTTMIDPTMPGYGMGWWVSREQPLVSDAGAYGATPWLDLERRFGVMFIIEGEATQGALFRFQAQPLLEQIFDAR